MALRVLAKHSSLLRGSYTAQAVRWQTTAPTVYDKMIQITVIGKDGHRFPIRGRIGQTVAEVLRENEDTIGEENICLSPEGRNEFEAHIMLPNEFLEHIPHSSPQDKKYLEEIAPTITKNSRLGSKVTLTKDLNDMRIALGDLYPWKTL
ncbi:hypothetical protein WJX72_012112 [[Myrmecia] bisecta]|uniref:Uncharacterized protein n=1 Tax=[Myrmecia] bisecta TaxID=41462 RepID=A0AAW1QT63_9CHLO